MTKLLHYPSGGWIICPEVVKKKIAWTLKNKDSSNWDHMRGRIVSAETRKKTSETEQGYHTSPKTEFKKGQVSAFKGRLHTIEDKKKISLELRGKYTGKKHWNFKGGAKPYRHKTGNAEYKEWREKVFERDNYTCQNCGIRSKSGVLVYLEAHHKKGWTKYPALRYVVENGVTLCRSCHLDLRKKHDCEIR